MNSWNIREIVSSGLGLVPSVPQDVRRNPYDPEHNGNHKDH